MTSSLVVSLTILPALSGRLHNWGQLRPTWLQTGFSNPRLTRAYRWTLEKAFGRPILTISLLLILPVIGFALAPDLKQQFFPPTGRDQFYIEFELSSQTALEQTQSQVLRARDSILNHPDVVDVHWFIGESAPTFYYNVVGSRENAANYAQGLVQLRPNVLPRSVIQSLQSQLDLTFPDAMVIVRQLEQGPPFDAPVEVRLYGSDLKQLQHLGDQMRTELSQVKDVVHTRASLTEAQPKLAVKVDEEQARLVGLDRTAIARQLNTTLEGDLDRIAALDLLPNADSTGDRQTIPLATVGEINLVPDIAVIPHRNGQRVNTVQGFTTAGTLSATTLAEFEKRLQAIQLPPGYSFEFGGESEERGTAVTNLLSTVGVLGVLMTATLVLTFNSFALAGSIALIAILSAGLGLAALWLSGYPFGFTAILGTIGLIGIAVNEATVVIAALQSDFRASSGDRKAVQMVVVSATRHLVATTITDIAGFTPLLFDPTGFWNPLAIIIAGGLGGVTLLSLYFVPSVYLLLARRKSFVPT